MTDTTSPHPGQTTPAKPVREWTDLDLACDRYIRDYAKLDPIAATDWGMLDDPSALPDLSPDGLDARAELDAAFLASIPGLGIRDDVDQVTADALNDRLALAGLLHDGKEDAAELNNLASPLQAVTQAFSLMATKTVDDWKHIVERMKRVPTAVRQYAESLRYAADSGIVAARRQVLIGIGQCETIGTPGSSGAFFELLIKDCPSSVADHLGRGALEDAASTAAKAYRWLGAWLKDNLLPLAPDHDPVGRDRYELFSALFVGARVDLDETYQWGIEELARIVSFQEEIAADLYGRGTSVAEAYRRLDQETRYELHGEDALLQWLQSTGDRAIADLNGTQFSIAPELRVLQARIAPSKEGGVWYTGPSADFSRPGQMWWSIPEGDTVFHTWQEKTTVFHEGIPGHHLQIAQAVYESGSLNLWRRLGSWNSGHGEGWALYAEKLMADLGYMADPGDRMGMLDGQRLRAARVVLDIGMHLGKPRLDGGGAWDAEYAHEFLQANTAMSAGQVKFELDRYLGWPGQAPSYKIGERLWLGLRDDYVKAHSSEGGREEIVRSFHTKALSVGCLPMDTLRQAVLG